VKFIVRLKSRLPMMAWAVARQRLIGVSEEFVVELEAAVAVAAR
jgi:hypothetical protein